MSTVKETQGQEQSISLGLYLYCIVRQCDVPQSLWDIRGLEGEPLESITHRDLAAVVSHVRTERQRASRENLMAHTLVLEKIMEHQQLLPVRFGIVAKTQDDVVSKVLQAYYWEFLEILKGLDGKKELGLKVFWNHDAIMGQIIADDAQIRDLRDKVAGQSPESSYYQRINLGRLVEAALSAKRDYLKTQLLEALLPLATDHRENKLLTENMVLNAAFLVPVNNEEKFDEALNVFEGKYQDLLTFKYTAVAPPYNFVNIAIQL
ncbi:MAG: GvpL/GvpF family gas vesicle protein [Candidatus Melainabacteria bacterium]|nr:GvpL/GvpF family gas vesicle protein [Candidatus Melainabacteria bacterium]